MQTRSGRRAQEGNRLMHVLDRMKEHGEQCSLIQSRRNAAQERNKRMFANIQSALGTPGSSCSSAGPLRDRRRAPVVEEKVEEVVDVDAVIAQISDLSLRPDRSAAQIKRNIASSRVLSSMDEDEWTKLAEALLDCALKNGETEFVVGLFVTLMGYETFNDLMCGQLMTLSSTFIMDEPQKYEEIPAFLGTILCATWPRNMSKAIDTVNPILFTVMSIVKGWILVLDEDNDAEKAKEALKAEKSEDSDSDQDDIEDVPAPREDAEIVNRCARALTSLCDVTQRSLWMKWPELCDEIYGSVKTALTMNNALTSSTKSGLLQTFLALNSWTKVKAVNTRTSSTQTV